MHTIISESRKQGEVMEKTLSIPVSIVKPIPTSPALLTVQTIHVSP